MNVLLDTHIFLWSLIEPERLTSRHHELLGDRQVQIWLSPITIWECLLLSEKGRVELLPSAPFWLDNAVTRIGAKEAALNSAVALRSRVVSMSHQDPADRFLAATAAVYDIPLVTVDEKLLNGSGYPIWA